MARPRRASSGLGADIRGDTNAPAMSTLERPQHPRQTSNTVREYSPLAAHCIYRLTAPAPVLKQAQLAALERAESSSFPAKMETNLLQAHLAHPSYHHSDCSLRLCRQSHRVKSRA